MGQAKADPQLEHPGRATCRLTCPSGGVDSITPPSSRRGARALDQANTLLSRSLTDRIIRYEAVQKLAATVTSVLLPSDASFLLPADVVRAPRRRRSLNRRLGRAES
jgi:hypothetical protein